MLDNVLFARILFARDFVTGLGNTLASFGVVVKFTCSLLPLHTFWHIAAN
jgi:hypothetical protein